jgi:DNA-binding LytR/AlgR family response regulator
MLKIQIVEDDLLEAEQLQTHLEMMNLKVVAISKSAEEAIADFEKHEPHLLFIDINLQGDNDGIYVAEYINRNCRVPFIYLSNNFGKESSYFKRATATVPSNYLPKGGYLPKHLWHFVEVAFTNYMKAGGFYIDENESNLFIRNHIFIKTVARDEYQKVNTEDIVLLQYNKPYTNIFLREETKKATMNIRKSIDYVIAQLNATELIRIHKSHAVNINYIKKYNDVKNTVTLNNDELYDVGKAYQKGFEERIRMFM